MYLDGLDLKVESDQREHETLEILHEIVKASEALGVATGVHIDQGADLGRREGDVLIAHHDLQLLTADAVRLRPNGVVLGDDLGVFDDAAEFVLDGGRHERLFADHRVVLVVGVVGVAEFSVGSELELEEFVPELALVADVITQVEIVRHLEAALSLLIVGKIEFRGGEIPLNDVAAFR